MPWSQMDIPGCEVVRNDRHEKKALMLTVKDRTLTNAIFEALKISQTFIE